MSTQTTTTNKYPNAVYAAAGAGDIAIENLRKLPERVAVLQERLSEELPGRLTGLQDKVTAKVAELPSIVAELRQRVVDADADKLRDAAKRNAGIVLSNAQVAQERAAALYAQLVTRGEAVVAGRTTPTSRREPVHAEVITSKPAAKAETSKATASKAETKVETPKAEAPKAAASKAATETSKRSPKAHKSA